MPKEGFPPEISYCRANAIEIITHKRWFAHVRLPGKMKLRIYTEEVFSDG